MNELDLSPHGTPARARWHYRQGDKPLRKKCPACADANAWDVKEKKEKRKRRASEPAPSPPD